MLALVAGNPEDSEYVGTDHKNGVRAWKLQSFFGLELVQLGHTVNDGAVLCGSTLVITQLFERGYDLLVKLGMDGAFGKHSLSLLGSHYMRCFSRDPSQSLLSSSNIDKCNTENDHDAQKEQECKTSFTHPIPTKTLQVACQCVP